ncbi:alkaline phosphatase family protein [Oerskovia sp. M15]
MFTYWGPTAAIASSAWIVDATRHVLRTHSPELTMAYVPHLDYDLQRFGPDSPQADAAAAELDAVLAPLLDDAANNGIAVVVVSEYGIAEANRPVHLNRILRREGLLEVYVQDGTEQLDPWTSKAFAVADHQVAHVYVDDPRGSRAWPTSCAGARRGRGPRPRGAGPLRPRPRPLGRPRGDRRARRLVHVLLLARRRPRPEYARGVDIHRKPGYDPAELFFDPADPLAKAKAGLNLVKKKVGLRYAMSTVPLDASHVRGTHGRLPDSAADTPLILCSEAEIPASVAALVERGDRCPPRRSRAWCWRCRTWA